MDRDDGVGSRLRALLVDGHLDQPGRGARDGAAGMLFSVRGFAAAALFEALEAVTSATLATKSWEWSWATAVASVLFMCLIGVKTHARHG